MSVGGGICVELAGRVVGLLEDLEMRAVCRILAAGILFYPHNVYGRYWSFGARILLQRFCRTTPIGAECAERCRVIEVGRVGRKTPSGEWARSSRS